MKIDRSGLKSKYTASFVLASVIPVLVVMLVFYLPVLSLFKNTAIRSNSVKSGVIRDIVDIRTQELSSLAIQLGMDNRIKSLLYKTGPFESNDIINVSEANKLIGAYKAGNKFVSYMAVYLVESNKVITHEGMYDADFFFGKISKFENMDLNLAKLTMSYAYYSKVFPLTQITGNSNLNDKYITYVQSLPVGEKKALANVIMYVNQRDMLSMMGVTGESQKDKMLILSEGIQIFSTNNVDNELKAFLTDNIKEESGSFIHEVPDGDSVLVSYSNSKLYDWSYIVFSNMNDIISGVQKIRNIAVAAALFSVLIAILLSFLLAKYSYKPWLNLVKYLGAISAKKIENEYQFAIKTFDNIKKEHDRLLNDMVKSKDYITKYILQNLCSGTISNDELTVESSGLFSYKRFAVIAVDSDKSDQLRKTVIPCVIKLVTRYYDSNIYSVFDEKDRICLVLNTSMQSTDIIINKIRHLRKQLESHFGIVMHIGAGEFYEDKLKLQESYKEARKSLDYCLLKGNDYVVYYPEIDKYIFSSLNLPIHSENPLLNAVKAGDYKSCQKLLDEYFGKLTDAGNFSMQYMYCLFYNFVTVIMKACEETHADFAVVFERNPEQILDIEQYRSSKQLVEGVYSLYMTMCDYVQKKKVPYGNFLKKQIENLLNNNYNKKCISLVEIADILGYSSSYLSRFINQEFGMGFGDLLNKFRLDNAKKLIISEQMSINKIAELCGYSSVNSFTRTFKQKEGVTPSQYREMKVIQIGSVM